MFHCAINKIFPYRPFSHLAFLFNSPDVAGGRGVWPERRQGGVQHDVWPGDDGCVSPAHPGTWHAGHATPGGTRGAQLQPPGAALRHHGSPAGGPARLQTGQATQQWWSVRGDEHSIIISKSLLTGLTDRSFHVVPPHSGRGWGVAISSPSSPVHSALQPAYSSPQVYSSQANIYAEVETDTEIDSGFTEESVSQEGDKSLYTAISHHGLSSLGYTMDNQV